MNNAPRFSEPQDNMWDRITFEYIAEDVRLIPKGFETDGFVDDEEIQELGLWTLTFRGELWNGAPPDVTCALAKRFDGNAYRVEPVTGALEALIEAYIYRKDRREKVRIWAIENGERHYRSDAA